MIDELSYALRLKNVFRTTYEDIKRESEAEHTYACLILADTLLPKEPEELDHQKVKDLLLYHGLPKIETGDVDIRQQQNDEEDQQAAIATLEERLPSNQNRVRGLIDEYLAQQTPEARYAASINALEPIVHWYPHINRWEEWGFGKEALKKYKEEPCTRFESTRRIYEEALSKL